MATEVAMQAHDIYPYELMDNMNKMNYTNLPPQENFYSTLTMQHITDEDYKHAQNVWNTLQMTGVKLELLTEEGMHLMVEEGVRGGVSTIITRHAKANNKYMGENFDREAESVYLLDLDANNLYGWAMSQSLPTDDFRWVLDEEIEELQANIMKLDQDSERGYILEVLLKILKTNMTSLINMYQHLSMWKSISVC